MDRTEKMQKLRIEGLSFGDISKIFGVSRQRVWSLVTGYRRLPDNLRYEILRRDNHSCQKCDATGSKKNRPLEVHHLDGNSQNNVKTNLVTVCHQCHTEMDLTNKYLSNYK